MLAAAVATLLALAAPCYADTIELPAPQADQLGGGELFQALGASRDQLPGYLAPGPLSNDELVQVEVSGDGRVRRVTDEQRIRITGTGDYFVRESGPARAALSVGGDVPVLSLGDIVWQGFSTGSQQLAARIELDPELESAHLPIRVGLTFTTAGGQPTVLGPDRQVPGAGTLTLTLDNTSRQPATLPTGADATARQLATALDRLRAAAPDGTAAARLPTTRTGIPPQLQVTGAGSRQAEQLMPLRLRGSLSVRATGQPSAPGSAVRLDSLLQGSSRFSLQVRQPGTVTLELTAVPALDPRSLIPPRGAPSWSAWAGTDPPIAERRAALDLLVQAAATGSRASAYSPYLGSQLETRGRTTFRYLLAAARPPVAPPARLTPRPVPNLLVVLGALALLGSGVVLWRRS
ncbi:MAG TPA: hypothetical protein VGX49_06565 [Jatrophihabitans sp.]|nr:hypothetical protein [Jatrophihabitans sp.]